MVKLHKIKTPNENLINCKNGHIIQLPSKNYSYANFLIFLKNNNSIDVYHHKSFYNQKTIISDELLVSLNFLSRISVDSFEVLLTKNILKISIVSGNEIRIVFASLQVDPIIKISEFESMLIHGKYQAYMKHSLLLDQNKQTFILGIGLLVKYNNKSLSTGDMLYMDPIGNIDKVAIHYSGSNCKFIHIYLKNIAEICDDGTIRSRKFNLFKLKEGGNILSYTNKINIKISPNKLESFGWIENFYKKRNRINVTIDI
ncbi:Hypothetical protein SRAE_2000192800 [Strongyloides ratti]|uniref:Uncharacterized protein n=1 Tax=Strongyloides ratti TaxID=34506 RepID=A0A090MYI9_STRRB|nr:Hypothetical protein SRAE_2000192800 [Strongyloides ratti]CEF67264.1 Hypothetical protein SRAE_2000192800 [Strongyloides ratti]